MITKTEKAHRDVLYSILETSGQFDSGALAHVMETLDTHFKNPGEEIWLTVLDDDPVGFAYCAPEPVTSGTWNLLMLWTKEGFQGQGFGKALVAEVENQLKERNARLLVVETSQLPEFESARAFYHKYGFVLEAEVKDFFDDGDNKLIYTKSVG